MDDVFKLNQQLASLRSTNEFLVDKVRALDMADVERRSVKPAEVNYMLKFTQGFVAEELANHVEDYRWLAWTEQKGFLVDHPPQAYRKGEWPEGVTPEAYVRKFHGLNDEGTALAGETPPKPEPIKLSPELKATIARLMEGKT